MKLENQVCSLKLAKRLKELGVKQASLYSHWQFYHDETGTCKYSGVADYKRERKRYGAYWVNIASAFTVAELGEMLPDGYITVRDYATKNWIPFDHTHLKFLDRVSTTEADARAQMLIYAIENKLVTP